MNHNSRFPSINDLFFNTLEILVSIKFVDQDGEYIHEEKVVEVELINSSIRDMYEILTNVVNMWFGELHQIGAIDRVEPIHLRKPGLVSRDKASRVSLEITKGIRMKVNFRFQKYNYESNLLEPVDFSDAENIVFTVSRRPTFKLVLKNSSGVKKIKEFELTSEQEKMVKLIDDQRQRKQYLMNIVFEQGYVGQMLVEHKSAKNTEQKS